MARGRSGIARQAKIWDGILGSVVDQTGAETVAPAGIAVTDARTVLRMIGEYVISLTGAATLSDAAFIAVAIGIVSSDAFAAGAIPDPADEPEYPWLYWADHAFNYGTAVGTGSGGSQAANGSGAVRRHFDIRSMRKMKPRETLCTVVQYRDNTGAPPITTMFGVTRVLFGLH